MYGNIFLNHKIKEKTNMYKNLKKYRESAGISQAEMAKLLSVSRSFYTQLENGSRRLSLPMAQRIAMIIGNKLGWPEKMSWLDELFFVPDVAKRDKKAGGSNA